MGWVHGVRSWRCAIIEAFRENENKFVAIFAYQDRLPTWRRNAIHGTESRNNVSKMFVNTTGATTSTRWSRLKSEGNLGSSRNVKIFGGREYVAGVARHARDVSRSRAVGAGGDRPGREGAEIEERVPPRVDRKEQHRVAEDAHDETGLDLKHKTQCILTECEKSNILLESVKSLFKYPQHGLSKVDGFELLIHLCTCSRRFCFLSHCCLLLCFIFQCCSVLHYCVFSTCCLVCMFTAFNTLYVLW